jgi:flagellar hook-basal body complex protein FliE
MNINGLGSLTPPAALPSSAGRANSAAGGGAADSSFGSTVRQAVESLDNSQKSAEQEVTRAVTGESTDLHKTIIALQSADLNFQFALQVRNKLVGAYEEIMRMQV